MQLSLEVVRLFIQSEEEFPVDLDDAWKWLGFKAKRVAKQLLIDAFEPGLDFLRSEPKATGGRPSEVFMLSVECFKSLGMMANTEKGREVRKYFIECERKLKEVLRLHSKPQPQPQTPPPVAQPKSLPPAPGWKPEIWDKLPEEDKQHFSESQKQVDARLKRERADIDRFLDRCWYRRE